MKKAIVNVFSKGRDDYKSRTLFMLETIKRCGYIGDIIIFSPDHQESIEDISNEIRLIKKSGWPRDCRSHNELPYYFKSNAIQWARENNYDEVLWCDSSRVFLKNPQKYFELAEEIGVIAFDAEEGATEHIWTSDKCLEILECNLAFAKTFNQCNAGTLFFNFNNKRGRKIFDEYLYYCGIEEAVSNLYGSSRPEFKAHRHDQSIISFLIKKYGMNNLSYGGLMWEDSFKKRNPFDLSPTFIF